MLSSIAQVEPFPFVPATVTTGHEKRMSIRRTISRMRSSPMSMGLACRASIWESHSSSVAYEVMSVCPERVCTCRAFVLFGLKTERAAGEALFGKPTIERNLRMIAPQGEADESRRTFA